MSVCGICHKCIEGAHPFTGLSGLPVSSLRMIVCETCGNKRCPHGTDCDLPCTGSNEPGQQGSIYQ
jgi:hypothetical protein